MSSPSSTSTLNQPQEPPQEPSHDSPPGADEQHTDASGAQATESATESTRRTREKVPVVKVSFNLPADELQQLRDLGDSRRVTTTQALRQAIATEWFLANQPEGSKVLIETPDGRLREVVFRG